MSRARGFVFDNKGDAVAFFVYNGASCIARSRRYKTEREMIAGFNEPDSERRCTCGNPSIYVLLHTNHGGGFLWQGKVCLTRMALTRGYDITDEPPADLHFGEEYCSKVLFETPDAGAMPRPIDLYPGTAEESETVWRIEADRKEWDDWEAGVCVQDSMTSEEEARSWLRDTQKNRRYRNIHLIKTTAETRWQETIVT